MGHNFAILGPTEKQNMRSPFFGTNATYKIAKFQGSTQIGFQDIGGT